MSITIKSKSELAIMREAGRITCGAIWYAGERLRPGMSTLDVDKLVEMAKLPVGWRLGK